MVFSLFRRRSAKKHRPPADGNIYFTDLGSEQVTKVPYLLAHDVSEQNRLDFQHFFLKGILGKNYLAPLVSPLTILDVGSGTGRWVAEMAQEFPNARVTGIDVAPAPPPTTSINAHFVQQDILKGLPFLSASFDYVHARLLVAAIPVAAWPGLLQEYLRVVRPGGWIELFEGGTTFVNIGPLTQQYLQWWNQVSQQRGIDASYIEQLPSLMATLNMQNIQAKTLHVPVGEWGGRVGVMLRTNMYSGWGALKEMFVSQAKVAPDLFDRVFQGLPQEWEQRHTMYEYLSVIGQASSNT
jgi:SAM-dependent methyltransferase